MADNLQISYNYLNPYEEYYAKFKTRDTYNKYTDQMFKRSANYGELNQIVYTLDELQKRSDEGTIDFDTLSQEYQFDLGDNEFVESVLLNEMFGDKEKIVHYEEEVWNEGQAKYEIKQYDLPEYELNKMLFKRTADYNAKIDKKRILQEQKDNQNGFVKFLSGVAAAPFEILDGVFTIFDGVLSLAEGTFTGLGYAISDNDFAEGFSKAYKEDTHVLNLFSDQGFRAKMHKWLGTWSHLRDVNGNYTTYGQWLGGISNSIGQMLPSLGVGKALGALGVNAKAAAVTQQLLYYGGMGSNTFREFVNDPRLAGVSAGKKLARAVAQTAIEYAVQASLNKCFGPSMMDKAVFGYQGASKAIAKVSTWSAVKRIGMDAIHEGLEEMLQQYSNTFVDRFFALNDENYKVTTEWDFKTMMTAFGMGALSSIAMSTFDVVKTRIGKRVKSAIDTKTIQKAIDDGVFDTIAGNDTDIRLLTDRRVALEASKNIPADENTDIAKRDADIDKEIAKVQSDIDAKTAQSRQLRTEYKIDKTTEKAYRESDKSIVSTTPKMNMFKEWQFNATITDVMQEGMQLLNDKRLSNVERGQILGQMTVTMECIASIYGDVGQEIATNAQNLIKAMQESAVGLDSTYKDTALRRTGRAIKRLYTPNKSLSDYRLRPEANIAAEGKAAYAAMASTIMTAINSMRGAYNQKSTANLTEENKEKVVEQTEKITHNEQDNAETAAQALANELGGENLFFENNGSEQVSTERTVAKRISKNDNVELIVERINYVCEKCNMSLDEYEALPKEIKDFIEDTKHKHTIDLVEAVQKWQSYDKRHTKKKRELLEQVQETVDLKSTDKIAITDETREIAKRLDEHKKSKRNSDIQFMKYFNELLNKDITSKPDNTDALQVISEVKETVINEPVQALVEADTIDAIAKAIVDLALPKALMSNMRYRLAFNELFKFGKELLTRADSNTEITAEYVMSALLLDTDFVNQLVQLASQNVIDYLDGLYAVIDQTTTDTAIDRQIRNRLEQAAKNIKNAVRSFAMETPDLKPELLKMFTDKETKEILRYRIGPNLVHELRTDSNLKLFVDVQDGKLIGITITTVDNKSYADLSRLLTKTILAAKGPDVKLLINALIKSNSNNLDNSHDISGEYVGFDTGKDIMAIIADIMEDAVPNQFNNKYNTGEYFQMSSTENIIANGFFEKNGITRKSFLSETFIRSMIADPEFLETAKVVYKGANYTEDINSQRAYVFAVFNELFRISNGYTYELYLGMTEGHPNYNLLQVRYIGTNDRTFKTMFTGSGDMLSLFTLQAASKDIKNTKDITTFIDVSQSTDITYKEYGESQTEWKEYKIEFINSDLTAVQRVLLTMSDILTQFNIDEDGKYTSELLSKDVQKSIIDEYGELLPQTAYCYLHDYFLHQTHGQMTIVLGKDGKVYTINIQQLNRVLKKGIRPVGELLSKLKHGDSIKLRDVIANEYLSPALADIEVKIDNNLSAYGQYNNNTITLRGNRNIADMQFTLLHEYRHAVQDYFKLNGGFTISNLFNVSKAGIYSINNSANTKIISTMIRDLKDLLHVPTNTNERIKWYTEMLGEETIKKNKLSENVYNWNNLDRKLLADFIYYTSGEAEAFAYNLSYNKLFAPFATLYSTLIDTKAGTITLPNGKKYNVSFPIDVKPDQEIDTNKLYDYNIDDSMLNYNFAIINSQGNIKVNSNYSSLSELQDASQMNFDKQVCIVNNSGNGNIAYSVYINTRTITKDQYDAVIDFTNKITNGDGVVTLISVDNDFSIDVTSESQFNPKEALTQIGVFLDTTKYRNLMLEDAIETSERLKEQQQDAIVSEADARADKRVHNKGAKGTGIRTTRKNDTYVAKQVNKNSHLAPYAGQQVNKQLVALILNANYNKLNPELVEILQSGKASLKGRYGLFKWLRLSSTLDPNDITSDYTLRLLNKYIFKNSYIDSAKDLQTLVTVGAPSFYALRKCLVYDTDNRYLLDEIIGVEDLNKLILLYMTKTDIIPELGISYKAYFNKLLNEYSADLKSLKGTANVDEGTLKVRLLERYDGTIRSGYQIAKQELSAAKLGFRRDTELDGRSLDETVGDSENVKGEGGDLLLQDVIPDTEHFYALNPLDQTVLREEIAERLVDWQMENKAEAELQKAQDAGKISKNLTIEQKAMALENYRKNITKRLNNADIERLIVIAQDLLVDDKLDSADSNDFYEGLFAKTNTKIKQRIVSVKNSITRKANDIRQHLSIKSEYAKKAFLARYGNLFTEDLKLKDDTYKGKWEKSSIDKWLDLNDKLSQIRHEVTNGKFDHGEKGVKAYERGETAQQKADEKIAKEREKMAKKEAKYKAQIAEQQLQIGGHNFAVTGPDSDNIPQVFRSIMETTWTRFAKTNVQYLTEEGEVHYIQSMNDFMKANADTLTNMTPDEARQLADFIINNVIVVTQGRTATEAAELTRRYMLYNSFLATYLLSLDNTVSKIGETLLDKKQVIELEQWLKHWESDAGRALQSTRDIAKRLKPFKALVDGFVQKSQMAEFFADRDTNGEIIRNDDNSVKSTELNELTQAIRNNNQAEIQIAINRLEQKGWDRWAKINGRDGKSLDRFLDRFWKFQRLAMLSSPGTWVRNAISNTMVMGLNKASGVIGRLLTRHVDAKRGPIEGQWRMDAKPTQEVSSWIDQEFFRYTDANGNEVRKKDAIVMPLYDLLSDGLTKWTAADSKSFNIEEELAKLPRLADPARMTASEVKVMQDAYSDILTRMIGESIRMNIFMDGQFGSGKVGGALNKVSQMLFKVLSDDPWIRKATKEYFGKILQESINDYSSGKYTYTTIVDGKSITKNTTDLSTLTDAERKTAKRVGVNAKALTAKPNTPEYQQAKLQTLELFSKAYTLAAHDYMHRTNIITQFERQLSGKSKTAMFVYKQFMPFASAAWNWFVEGLNYSPFGLAKAIVDYARLEKVDGVFGPGKIEKAKQQIAKGKYSGPDISFIQYLTKRRIGKGIIGTIGWAAGLLFAGFGALAIDDEDDKIKLNIANVKIDISDIFGTSSLLAGAALVSTFKNEGNFWTALSAMSNQFLEDSIFTDLHMMFSYDNIGDAAGQFMVNRLSSVVPNIVKSANKLTYVHTPQYSKGMMGQLERWGVQLVPGLVEWGLPKRYDPYTGELQLKYAGNELINWLQKFIQVFGVKIYAYNFSDTEAEAAAQGVRKGELTGRYEDIGALNNKQKAIANEYYGKKNKQDLENLYNNKTKYKVLDKKTNKYVEITYSKMTTEQKKAVIERIMSDNSKLAKIYIYTQELGGKYYASAEEYKQLQKLGIKKNVYKEDKKHKGFAT